MHADFVGLMGQLAFTALCGQCRFVIIWFVACHVDGLVSIQASDSYKANLLKAKPASEGGAESSALVETHTDGVTALMVAAVGGHMVSQLFAVPSGVLSFVIVIVIVILKATVGSIQLPLRFSLVGVDAKCVFRLGVDLSPSSTTNIHVLRPGRLSCV